MYQVNEIKIHRFCIGKLTSSGINRARYHDSDLEDIAIVR